MIYKRIFFFPLSKIFPLVKTKMEHSPQPEVRRSYHVDCVHSVLFNAQICAQIFLCADLMRRFVRITAAVTVSVTLYTHLKKIQQFSN
jgi:hypothetical protein